MYMNSILLKTTFLIAIIYFFTSCNSRTQKTESNSHLFDKFKLTLDSNLQNENFDQIIKTVRNQSDFKLSDSQINILNGFALKFIIKYKNLYVKNSRNAQDTIFNGFILNESEQKFNKKLLELQKDDNYKAGRLSTVIGNLDGNVSQFSNDIGSTRLLIRPFFEHSKLTSFELNSFEQIGHDPLNKEFKKSYGNPLSGSDIRLNPKRLREENLNWLGVSKSIKENTFNPVKSFILMGGDLSKKQFQNYSNFWFTENFVIAEIGSSYVYQTHQEFLSEYQKKLNDIKKSKRSTRF